jgi:hypothetical protein
VIIILIKRDKEIQDAVEKKKSKSRKLFPRRRRRFYENSRSDPHSDAQSLLLATEIA